MDFNHVNHLAPSDAVTRFSFPVHAEVRRLYRHLEKLVYSSRNARDHEVILHGLKCNWLRYTGYSIRFQVVLHWDALCIREQVCRVLVEIVIVTFLNDKAEPLPARSIFPTHDFQTRLHCTVFCEPLLTSLAPLISKCPDLNAGIHQEGLTAMSQSVISTLRDSDDLPYFFATRLIFNSERPFP